MADSPTLFVNLIRQRHDRYIVTSTWLVRSNRFIYNSLL